MYQRTIKLKKGTPTETYTEFCNQAEKDNCFIACGNIENMWIMVRFEDEKSFKDWIKSLSK